MTQHAHSPGPYEVLLDYDNIVDEEIPGRHTIKDANGWNIARIWEGHVGNPMDFTPERATANAFLFGAAAEMFDELDALAKIIEGPPMSWGEFGRAVARNMPSINRVLAKALGEKS